MGRRGRAWGRLAGRRCGGQGRTGDLREVPLPLRGVTNIPPPEILGGRSGRPDTPRPGFLGSVGFLFGDFVILPPGCSPCGPFPSPLGPRLRHFVFLNRSHLHTTFSFIKNTAERGEPWVRGSACARVLALAGVLEPPPGSGGACGRGCTRSCAGDPRSAPRGVR